MSLAQVLVVSIFSCTLLLVHHHLLAFVTGDHSADSNYLGDVAINCGSTGKSNAFDGREWIGDAGSELMSSVQSKGKSKRSTAVDRSFSADPIPYRTSRISATPFHYKFRVSPGQKFIRLHFHRAPYQCFKGSEDLFTVKAGPFTLLYNFSASLTAEALGANSFVKEFCLNIDENSDFLIMTFSPSKSSTPRKVFAFVNGIEIISMPTGLYYTTHEDLGARIVGLHNRFAVIDNSTALELIERLNTGASSILSVEDFGLFRRWNGDSNYLVKTEVYQVSHPAHRILYTRGPAYVAPAKLYQTSWTWRTAPNVRVRGLHTFRWKIPVDVGFGYLVRLHFCDFDPGMTGGGKKEFSVLMNDQIAEAKIDVISWGGGIGVPVYSDYLVMMKGDKGGKCDLFIALRSADELVVELLNGLEIFKLSNPDNSLASPNLVLPRGMPSSWKQKIHQVFTSSRSNVITNGAIIILVLVNLIVYNKRQSWEASVRREENPPLHTIDPSFCFFSLSEIQSATQNFSDAAVIGRGGFGKVYKGLITRISQVAAIKRLKANSKQGAGEFWTEVETLSKFRHIHLVSLIGYCNEGSEMILVYEYMPRGTLADNIYRLAKNGKDCVILSWEERLRICIGAARGLEYLHMGTEQGVIHRDVKDTNILLDENFVAKISDFGLSKLEVLGESKSHISTKVKGTYGYLDPEYHMTGKLTKMVDVYAFGVVLLVVLSGRPAVEVRIPEPEEQQSLLSCFRECITERDFMAIVDPNLRGSISPSSLKEFVKCVEKCLHHQPKKRLTMAQLATSLELALEKQKWTTFSVAEDVEEINQPYEEDESVESMQFSQSPAPPVLEESVPFLPREGINEKPIQSPPSPTKAEETQLREDPSTVKRPTWAWPWKTARSREKPAKKVGLVSSSNEYSPRPSTDSGPRYSIQDIRAAANSGSDGFQTVDARGRKACVGFMEQHQKPVIIYPIRIDGGGSKAWEVYMEIEELSKLRHVNLQSLIGYAVDESEDQKFIIHEHIGFESLDNHLYCTSKSQSRNTPLPWKRRLNICIGVAEGLIYLKECTRQSLKHYDLSLSNILLDENWTPKISHFISSQIHYSKDSSFQAQDTLPAAGRSIRTDIAPWLQLQRGSDLGSFGQVLIEVVFARRINLEDYGGYLHSLQKSIKSRTFHLTIDSSLKGEIGAKCLGVYLEAIFDCILGSKLLLGDVASKLKLALQLQEKAEATKEEDDLEAKAGSDKNGFSLEDVYEQIYPISDISIS